MAQESVSVETQPETTVETVSTETQNKPDTAKGKGVPVKKGKVLLHRLESAIAEGYKGFWIVGESLLAIKSQELYLQKYSGSAYESFTAYLEGRWGYTSRAYQLMTAARIRQLMLDIGVKNPDSLFKSEAQYRENASILKLERNGKLEELKQAVKAQKKLTHETLGLEVSKLLPPPKEKAVKPKRNALAGELKALQAKIRQKLVALREKFPNSAEEIGNWTKALPESLTN